MRATWITSLLLTVLLCACSPEQTQSLVVLPLSLDSVQTVSPTIEGSPIIATLSGTSKLEKAAPTLEIEVNGQTFELEAQEQRDNRYTYICPKSLSASFVDGVNQAQLKARSESRSSLPKEIIFEHRAFATTVSSVSEGPYHWNEKVIFQGDGFLYPFEGTTTAHLIGTFTTDVGEVVEVERQTSVHAANLTTRKQGYLILHPSIGSARPGRFNGKVVFRTKRHNGHENETEISLVRTVLGPEVLFLGSSDEGSVEELVSVGGAGFVDAPGQTRVYLNGIFTPRSGRPFQVENEQLFATFKNGSHLIWRLDSKVANKRLASAFFDAEQGRFEGTATAEVDFPGAPTTSGKSNAISFTLAPVKQVVWIRFSANFQLALEHFGFQAIAPQIESAILNRVRQIYADYRLDIREKKPTDFHANGYSIVDVEGDNPNGTSILGLDATPGLDVGNLRLHDLVGGLNAQTQADGAPGYGGVFINSFISVYSKHPSPLPAARIPSSDPLFDEVFDPVRQMPVLPNELESDDQRGREVQRAFRAFTSLVGETVAHEIGHSLGMVEKGHNTHNPTDGKGCLMDAGAYRPLKERFAEPNEMATRICRKNLNYLDSILAK